MTEPEPAATRQRRTIIIIAALAAAMIIPAAWFTIDQAQREECEHQARIVEFSGLTDDEPRC